MCLFPPFDATAWVEIPIAIVGDIVAYKKYSPPDAVTQSPLIGQPGLPLGTWNVVINKLVPSLVLFDFPDCLHIYILLIVINN